MSHEGPSTFGKAGDESPYRTPQQNTAQKRLQQTQAQVEEVVGIMRVNVEKVLERDQKLSELDNRADALQQGASQFEQQAGKLKRKFFWQNLKMMIVMGVIGVVVLIIIIVWITSSLSGSEEVTTHAPTTTSTAKAIGSG